MSPDEPTIRPPRTLGAPHRAAAWSFALLLLVAAVVRCLGLDKSLWIDEASSHAQATAGSFLSAARNYDHPPLYFLLLRAAAQVTDSFAGLRLLSVLFGLFTVCVSATLRPRQAGWLAALLVALHPPFVAASQEMRQYALLTACLAVLLRVAWEPPSTVASRRVLVVGASLAAVTTHLVAAFFICAVGVVSAWQLRCEPWRRQLENLALYVPATVVAWVLKSWFLTQTVKDPAEWWPGPASLDALPVLFSRASGWSSLSWLADAAGRAVPGSGLVLRAGLAATALALVMLTGWRATSRSRALIAVALIYWGLLIGYSFAVANLLLVRLILPGMLPLLWALALAVAEDRLRWRRTVAAACAAGLSVAALIPWAGRFAWKPVEDIRGLAATLRAARGPEDQIIVLGNAAVVSAPEYAIGLYWREFADTRPWVVQAGRDPQAQLAPLAARQNEVRDFLLVYRNDPNLRRHPERVRAFQEVLRQWRGPPQRLWERDQYFIERYAR